MEGLGKMIDMKKFYGIASILMVISFLGNLWNTITVWNAMTTGAKIANIAGSLLFNILLFALFYGLWKITPSMSSSAKIIDNPDLDALIKQYAK